MAKAISDDIAYKGSGIIIAVKFPKVDDIYSFADLLAAGYITVKHYIINTSVKTDITNSLYRLYDSTNNDYDNIYAFYVDTTNLKTGVLMVEVTAKIPAHGNLVARTEIARCSTGIAILE